MRAPAIPGAFPPKCSMPRDEPKPRPSKHVEAFKENFNLVGLASAAALSAATLTPIPLLIGLVAEAAYLMFAPDSKWFSARLTKKFEAEIAQRREALEAEALPQLRPVTVDRYQRLKATRQQMASQPMEGQWWLEVLRKLDYLLETFLQFAIREMRFRTYLDSVLAQERGQPLQPTDPGFNVWVDVWDNDRNRRGKNKGRAQQQQQQQPRPAQRAIGNDDDTWVQSTVAEIQSCYDREMEGVRKLLNEETDDSTKAVLNKRLEVIQRRHEHVGKIGRILINLNHQLLLLDDTFGLINDEIRARPPEQVLGEIEDVVSQTESMTQLLEEIAPYEQMLQRLNH
jgi:hypothetical protein